MNEIVHKCNLEQSVVGCTYVCVYAYVPTRDDDIMHKIVFLSTFTLNPKTSFQRLVLDLSSCYICSL